MAVLVRAIAKRVLRIVSCLALPLLTLLAVTAVALACVAPAEPTTLTTSLSGESKSGESITVSEGAKVKDQATLEGKNAAKATGKISYAVYKDSLCKELVTKAGESEFKEGKVPASEEKTLEAGKVYYWQAHYGGDSLDAESSSTCGKEVLSVKAATSISTSLSGESKSGESITVLEGTKVKDKATLAGTNSATATGKVKFKAYKDSECKELATSAGEPSASGGSAESEEKTLEGGKVYYWQAHYEGDSLHQESTSTCKEVLSVKAADSLSTLLAGENPGGEKLIEGEEISVGQGAAVVDSAELSGGGFATATGEVKFDVYADSECEELVAEAGEESLVEGTAGPSAEVELEEGTYYWQASYEGDGLHQPATSPCGEVTHVIAGTTIATSLSGEGEEGEVIEVSPEAVVTDAAALSGPKAAEATGKVKYFVYGDEECTELMDEAGEATVAGEGVPASSGVTLEPGVYYWQAVYTGAGGNLESTSPCRSEVEIVLTPITTMLSAGSESAANIDVTEGTAVNDTATLHGKHAGEATGSVHYVVYGDEECEELSINAGKFEFENGEVPASNPVEFEEPGTYYWQAEYSGDEQNPAATSACGSEVTTVTVPTSLNTTLSGGEQEGSEITIEEGTPVSDQATLSGAEAASATGTVRYAIYSDSGCTEAAEASSVAAVEEGVAEPSSEATLPVGTYYWQAEYWGSGVDAEAIDECGAEILRVAAPITTSLSGGGQSGTDIAVEVGTAVTDQATLHGSLASEASGTIEYFVYEDDECEELLTNAGKFEFENGEVPASNPVELEEPGVYWFRAKYSGNGEIPPAAAPCSAEKVQAAANDWRYAAFGNSYSSGEGVRETIEGMSGSFYAKTNSWSYANVCHRSEKAWPALIAEKAFGKPAIEPPTVFRADARFIFRSCSGAVTIQVWPGEGKYKEWEEPLAKWSPKGPQINWLPGGMAANKVERVSVGIGGNDVGFQDIILACWHATVLSVFVKYSPAACLTEIMNKEAVGFPEIATSLPPILEKVEEKAPKAEVKVLLYPKPLHLVKGKDIPVGWGKVIDNTVAMKLGGMKVKETAAQAIERYTTNLNEKITKIVAAKITAKSLKRTEVVDATESAFTKFGPHQLGDPSPWLNKFAYYLEESFHPNVCGQKAVAKIAQPFLTVGPPAAVATC